MCPFADSVPASWRAWWPEHADAIVDDVRARLPRAVEAWGLRSLTPLPGGHVALVFAVATAGGEAVLKLSPRVPGETDELADEGAALALWAAAGVGPRVHGTRDGGLTTLMERIRPGQNLRDTGADAMAIVTTLGGLCPRIHLADQDHRFRALRDAGDTAGWRRRLAGGPEGEELERLLAPSAADRLLHIDLHWLNALRGPAGWVVIDPKPVIGDPHADVFAFFDGPPIDALPDGRAATRERVRRLTEAYARAARLDRDRLVTWIRLRALIFAGELADEGGTGTRARGEALQRLIDALD
jgi:streptomycin 6-kinase